MNAHQRRASLANRILKVIRVRFLRLFILSRESLEERFSLIYRSNYWGSRESRSGEGSEMREAASVIPFLLQALKNNDLKVIIDLGCGDCNWIRNIFSSQHISYHGYDIVEEVIRSNCDRFANDRINFHSANITSCEIICGDVILLKDVLIHFSFYDIDRLLRNILRTNFHFVVLTSQQTYPFGGNVDILSGDYRPLDFRKPPFSLPEEMIISRFPVSTDDATLTGKDLLLLNRQSIEFLCCSLNGHIRPNKSLN
jgi:hypothetical protein